MKMKTVPGKQKANPKWNDPIWNENGILVSCKRVRGFEIRSRDSMIIRLIKANQQHSTTHFNGWHLDLPQVYFITCCSSAWRLNGFEASVADTQLGSKFQYRVSYNWLIIGIRWLMIKGYLFKLITLQIKAPLIFLNHNFDFAQNKPNALFWLRESKICLQNLSSLYL